MGVHSVSREANAVITRDTPEWLASLPEPTAAEYKSSEEDTGLQIPEHPTVTPQVQVPGVETTAFQASIPVLHADPQVPQTHQEAIQAIRDEDFEGAIQFFQRLVIEQPNYHVGWLRLGYAQRERAMRLRDNDIAAAKELLAVSITSLTRAAQHQYDDQRARAVYERSKAEFHRYRIEAAPEYKRAAIEDATEACRLSPDTRYETWIEYLERIT